MGNDFNSSFPVSREPLDECSIGKHKCKIALWSWPIVSATIWLLIYLPIILYHAKKYLYYSKHIVYTNRYSDIVILQIKTYIIHLLLSINNIFSVWYVDQVQPLYTIYLSIETSVSIYLYYLFVWRFYLLYYDINFITESKNNQWIAVINPSLFKQNLKTLPETNTDRKFDYFLLNRNILGNKKYLYKNIIFPIVILSSIIFTITQLIISFAYQKEAGIYGNDSAFAKSYSITLTLKVIPFIILSIIYFKMPHFEDEFYVTYELQRLFLCLLMCIICIYGATLMQIWTQENLLWNAIIGPCITYNTIIFWHTLATYICSGWVNHKVKNILVSQKYMVMTTTNIRGFDFQYLQYKSRHEHNQNEYDEDYEQYSDDDDDEDSVTEEESANLFHTPSTKNKLQAVKMEKMEKMVEESLLLSEPKNQEEEEINNIMLFENKNNQELQIIDIIGHEKAFTAFMIHLACEFSMEILLSVYELISFKNLIKNYMRKYNISYPALFQNENDLLMGTNNKPISMQLIDNNTFHKDNTLNEIKLPKTYPKSFIVYHYENENENDKKIKQDIDVLELPMEQFTIHCKK
eukprot:400511_1